ncbi:hypothetical protein HMPREF3213_03965 [Heyndrickxia coagulans]|uniref:Uncharacterized protein n=1 Tax=Heyndrickxia coagulans TaxID=1398 RepID=A0A133K9F6_HEYCO|nr:hypothetical protein HMPREF3213_03965 [Heyndrickxia coagulans]
MRSKFFSGSLQRALPQAEKTRHPGEDIENQQTRPGFCKMIRISIYEGLYANML